jgi:hypothetical protein
VLEDAELGVNASSRANAAFVILARNSDVWEIVESIRAMEGERHTFRDGSVGLSPSLRSLRTDERMRTHC